jgi:hypothetical protein
LVHMEHDAKIENENTFLKSRLESMSICYILQCTFCDLARSHWAFGPVSELSIGRDAPTTAQNVR